MGLCSGTPKAPDPADGYVAGINADLSTLPLRRQIEAAAATGGQWTGTLPGNKGAPTTYDFTGLGTADYNAAVAERMAKELLQLQRDLGPAYVQQRLAELERADPEGHAGRQALWNSIEEQLQSGGTERAAAEQLQAGILEELQAGGQLPEGIRQAVSDRVLGSQVARGNWSGNAPAVQEGQALTDASAAQRKQRQAAALQFLVSGVSPEDVRYREDQQNLANLGSFLGGATPTAQFGQLSGAQNQIVPWTGSQPLSTVNPNAGTAGVNYANQNYAARSQFQQNQVNPWIAGLNGGVQALSTYAAWGGFNSPAPTIPNVPAVNTGSWQNNAGAPMAGQV
jgi:hypothetical protein